MKKNNEKEQALINEQAYEIFDDAVVELRRLHHPVDRLRSCKAYVHDTPNFYVLQSYNTLIACIDKRTGILVDVLRTEFGYTSTSAQHISKFASDYLHIPKWKATVLTTREV